MCGGLLECVGDPAWKLLADKIIANKLYVLHLERGK